MIDKSIKLKNVIMMGRKPGASKALKYLLSKGIKVNFVVIDQNDKNRINLKNTAESLGITVYSDDDEVYKMIRNKHKLTNKVDLVISYLFPRKIKYPLIRLGKLGCINFHPAPLPDYKSRAGYNTAILDQRNEFGVSAHFIDSEEFDKGPIIKVLKFPINPEVETALSLEESTQTYLLKLFKQVIKVFMTNKVIPTTKNVGGLYLTSKQLEKMKMVNPKRDSSAVINRKIRAFFFPPYSGAKIKIKGQDFTLVNEFVLKNLVKK
jgi:methionyl-tRNA formyltransferase